jgi:uncharacterized phage protein gp47/JayE
MTAPYIDTDGFHALGLQGWVDKLTTQYKGIFGDDLDLSSNTPDGQWINILAGDLADLEQLAQQVYNSRSAAGSVGAALSRLVRLNGITRKAATFSTAPATLSGTPGTVVPQGSLVGSNIDSNKPTFATTADVTIGAGGTVGATVQCSVTGPVSAAAGELTKIQSVVPGWTAVTNTSDATPGTNVEADPILRTRRAQSVAMPSQSMLDGLQAALRDLSGVADARVYQNDTGVPDEKGLPPHSIQAIVRGGVAADIANAIWLKCGMGVTKVGAQSLAVTDANGDSQTMKWDVAVDVDAYIVVALDKLTPNWSYLGDQIKNAIASYFAADGEAPAQIGQNIAWFNLAVPINGLGLTGRPGQPSVMGVYIGRTVNPTTEADLVVAYNEIAVFDVSRISVIVGPWP